MLVSITEAMGAIIVAILVYPWAVFHDCGFVGIDV